MKRIVDSILLGLLFISVGTGFAKSPSPQMQPPVAVNMFYSDLAPYGEWIEFDAGVYAWRPLRVDPDWRPYERGRWVWSDYGWYWVTYEPFGWATYHYGRWYFDDAYGWIWIPDEVWGPAWVEWRYNDEYIGWAPLPPYARFHISVGIRFTTRWVAPPAYWSFIPYRHFSSLIAYHDYVPVTHARRLITTTRSTGRYEIDQDRIVNRGIDRMLIERQGSTRIPRVEIAETRERGVERLSRVGQTEHVEIYRPSVETADRRERVVARRAQSLPSLDIDRIDRSRSTPDHDSGPSRTTDGGIRERSSLPNQGTGEQDRPFSRPERPELKRDRTVRVQPELPAPRTNRTIPDRLYDNRTHKRDHERSSQRF